MNFKNYIINMKKPFTRFLARIIDYSLFYTLFFLPLFFASLFEDGLTYILVITATPLLWIPVETLLISLLGTTPGKALFGIHVRDQKERKLSLKDSFKRALLVWVKGIGLNIPAANIACGVFSFRAIQKTGRTSVDEKLGVHLYHKKQGKARALLGALLVGLLSLCFIGEYAVRETFTSFEKTLAKAPESLSWKSYNDPEGAYSIQFPGAPEAESTQLSIPKSKDKLPFHAIKYQLDKEGIEYSLNYTVLPNNWLKWKPSLLLRGALKVLTSHLSEGKIVKKTTESHHKYPALGYTLKKKNNLQCAGRLVLVGNVLYKIDMTYPQELEGDIQEHLNAFLDSFQIK